TSAEAIEVESFELAAHPDPVQVLVDYERAASDLRVPGERQDSKRRRRGDLLHDLRRRCRIFRRRECERRIGADRLGEGLPLDREGDCAPQLQGHASGVDQQTDRSDLRDEGDSNGGDFLYITKLRPVDGWDDVHLTREEAAPLLLAVVEIEPLDPLNGA